MHTKVKQLEGFSVLGPRLRSKPFAATTAAIVLDLEPAGPLQLFVIGALEGADMSGVEKVSSAGPAMPGQCLCEGSLHLIRLIEGML